MKRFEKIFRGKISYKRMDKYVDLVRKTLDPDDEMQVEFDIQDDYQHIKIAKLFINLLGLPSYEMPK